MNCQTFENVVNDLARERLMDAASQHEGMRHARVCAACAARLSDERALTQQLRALAANVKSSAGSERVEARLLQAFDNQVRRGAQGAGQIYRRRYWLTAIAASLLIMFGLFIARTWHLRLPQVSREASVIQPSEPKRESNSAASLVSSQPENLIQSHASMANNGRRTLPRRNRQLPPPAPELTASSSNTEIMTEFFPVNDGGAGNLDAGGQIVRVELPRAAIAHFGLPVNMERSNEKIKADVLLGVDGLAHAIRFVGSRPAFDMGK
jgi:hypothetical protein